MNDQFEPRWVGRDHGLRTWKALVGSKWRRQVYGQLALGASVCNHVLVKQFQTIPMARLGGADCCSDWAPNGWLDLLRG